MPPHNFSVEGTSGDFLTPLPDWRDTINHDDLEQISEADATDEVKSRYGIDLDKLRHNK